MSNPDAVNRLESDPIGQLLLKFSLPAIVSMTVVALYHITSSIFIGYEESARTATGLAITGLAVTFPFMNLALAVCMMVAIGGATLCSIELGAKRQKQAELVLGHCVVLAVLLALAFSLPCLLFLDPILRLFGASDVTIPHARAYMEIILVGAPISNAMVALNHLMRASGYPSRAMLVSLLSVGLNLALTPALIFWCQLGIRGAAISTILSQLAALAGMLFHFCERKRTVSFVPGAFRLRWQIVRPILSVGLAPFFINACACLVVMIINLSLYRYGGDLSIGAYGIVNRLLLLFAMVIFGLTQGMQPLIGFNFGANRMDRVRSTLRYGIITATLITCTAFLAFQLAPLPLARLFTPHPEMVAVAVSGLRMCSAAFFLVGSQIVIISYFQSIGQSPMAIFLALSRQLFFLIPTLLILPRFFGLDGVWMSMPVADVLAFMTALFVLCRLRKNREGMPPAEA